MRIDAVQLLEGYVTEDRTKWAKLASDVQWRGLQLLLLREIVVELRSLNEKLTTSSASD